MPLVKTTYKPSLLFRNGYVSTVYSGLYRKSPFVNQKRERITLSDNDFLDLDWSYSKTKTEKLIIVLHGLEGNAQRPYILGVADLFNKNSIDAVCVNFRGCSGEDNRNYKSYHSGATEDLHEVIEHVLSLDKYNHIYINGFSLGGNVTLKYLGERTSLPKEIKAAVAVSVPCDLYGSCKELHKLKNRPYADMFLTNLKEKLYKKLKSYPDKLTEEWLSLPFSSAWAFSTADTSERRVTVRSTSICSSPWILPLLPGSLRMRR